MGTITIRDTVEKVGDASISTVEYVFSDVQDFLLWEASKRDVMNQAMKNFVDNQLFGGFDATEPVEESAVVDINVGKKETKH